VERRVLEREEAATGWQARLATYTLAEADGVGVPAKPNAVPYAPADEPYGENGLFLRDSGLFDPAWYLQRYDDVKKAGVDPLLHYLRTGAAEGRDPHPLFDNDWYLANNPDVAEGGWNPLAHYLTSGAAEGRDSHPLFDSDWYLANNPDVAEAGWNPLAHYLSSGAAEGRDPHPLFDSDWYLANYRDVAEAGRNPLLHYVTAGRSEGRKPRPADRFSECCNVLEIPFEIWRSPASLTDRDVCLFVTHSRNGHIWDHVLHYLDALIGEQFAVVLVIATDGIERVLPPELDRIDGIVVRANHGWDFAAWATGLAVFPDLWKARTLILANDSVYGPISRDAFQAVVRRVRSSEVDVLALTDSHEWQHHVQSYFIALTRSALTSPAVRQFWSEVRSVQDKWDVILTYEVPLLKHLQAHDVSYEVLFPTERDGVQAPLLNPTVFDWRDLVDRGFPFLKVELIRDRALQSDPTGWENRISDARLVRQIQDHLATVQNVPSRGLAVHRPIPSPRAAASSETAVYRPPTARPRLVGQPTLQISLWKCRFAIPLPTTREQPSNVLPLSLISFIQR
jgi:hypothetical protein